jgi:peptidyl-prolyl cis-trans isomerase SurA
LNCRAVIFAALVLCAFAGGCKKDAAPGPDVWASVNGKEIMRAQVEKYYRTRVNPEGPPPSQEEALTLKLNILDKLIDDDILMERAAKMNVIATDAQVEDKFTESKSPYTEEEFQRQLKETGLTVDDYKSDLRKQLSIQALFNHEVISKISITDQDINDFYNANRAKFNLNETLYHVAEIVITPHADPTVHNRKNDKATSEAEAGRKAAMLEQKLNGGADFSQMAMDYSEHSTASTGGDIGYISESQMGQADPILKKTVISMKAGEVSRPIQDKGGYFILKLVSKEPAGQRQLTDPQVQQTIRDGLRSRKEQLLRAAYLTEAREQARIANYLAREIIESAGKLPASK